MLTTYRRHRRNCDHRDEGRKYRRCRCPIWVDGFVEGAEVRKSLDTTNWRDAQLLVLKLETRESETKTEPKPGVEPITIQQAVERFFLDAAARKLKASTIYKYDLLFRQIGAFAVKRGLRYLKELDLTTLDDFRYGWKDGPRSALKKLERMRAFFRFCEKRKWIEDNPAAGQEAPEISICPTLPFTREEMLRILAAVDQYAERAGVASAHRLRAFVLLLRYSGMRIGDAVQFGPERLSGSRLFLYSQKTGVPVHCILPDFVIREIEAAPKKSDRYFFWTGESKLHTGVGIWQRTLSTLFTLAKVRGGHAHRFRDTFAVELLLSGIPLERVSVLLGHQSVRVTERHYNPWVRSRQEQLEADLRQAWSRDPVAQLQTKGTPEVHGKHEPVN